MTTSFILLLAFGGFAAVFAATDRDCSALEIFRCGSLVVESNKDLTSLWPENEKDLDTRCENTIPVLKCLYEYAKDCPNEDFAHMLTFFQEEYQTNQRVCTKGDALRERYLKNAKCANIHQEAVEKECGTLMEFKVATSLTKEHCEKSEKTINCHVKEFDTACGKEASSMIKELIKPAQDFMDKLCENKNLKSIPQEVMSAYVASPKLWFT